MPLRELTMDVVRSFQRNGLPKFATYVASYTSVFGHLASVFVLLLYVWVSANAFLVRIQLDASVRERA